MLVPVRCFSCGKPIGQVFEEYEKRTCEKGEDKKKVLDDLKLKRFCCRANIMSHINSIDVVGKY